MSLATRITALAQAIGADIKSLVARVSTLESGSGGGVVFSSDDKAKLDGITPAATRNLSNVQLLDRTNHTGVQAIATVNGLQAALDAKQAAVAGKGLSTNDYTTEEKTKLASLSASSGGGSTPAGVTEYVHPTDIQWANGTTYVITHNLGVVPRVFQVDGVAQFPLYGLATGETVRLADMVGGSATSGIEFRRPTATTVDMIVAQYGLNMMNASGAATSITGSQVKLRVRVRP